MKKRGQAAFLSGMFFLVAGCVTLSQGERLYRSRCSACHMLIPPREYSQEGWRYAVDRYGKHLTASEKEEVLEYLIRQRGNT